jgi:formylglycine-generating enzyme required for sulfatase activity
MGRIEKTVFISHRRTDEPWALAVFGDLTQHGYDVFIDYDGISNGNFETAILENIRARAHFLVLLTPTALERSSAPEDWIRREIEAALDSRRNIVPLMLEGFDFGTPAIANQLTGKLSALRQYNGLPIPEGYFSPAMGRLRNGFLNVPVDAVLHSASVSAQQAATEQKAKAAMALALADEQHKRDDEQKAAQAEAARQAREQTERRQQEAEAQRRVENEAQAAAEQKAEAQAEAERQAQQVEPSRFGLVTASVLGVVVVGSVGVWLAVHPPSPAVAPPEATSAQPPTTPFQSASSGAAPLSSDRERALKLKDTFKECEKCPEMVVVPAGSFTMGSPGGEVGRFADEGPQRTVMIGKPFAVGKFHVTVDQFAAFVAETKYDAGSKCWTFEEGKGEERSGRSWRNPGFTQAGSHPAVCMNWNDAKAYVDWLARKTGKAYRLLTEAQWEYTARAQTQPGAYPRYSFGNDEEDLCRYSNGADQTAKSSIAGWKDWTVAPCNDGYAYTSPVGSFAANGFGLYDMQGNAWQWTEDCYHDSYAGAPSDGSAWTTGDCSPRVFRGGAWESGPWSLRAADRYGNTPDGRSNFLGFRVGRTLTP